MAFAMQDAKVTFLDIDASGAQQTIDFAVQRNASKPSFIACDLTDVHALRKAVTQCASSQGDVDILVNNAANDDRHTWESVEPEYWAGRLAVNLNHVFFATQAVLPAMKARRSGGRPQRYWRKLKPHSA
jgi:D-xylose 1-dehydrogenase